MVMKMSEKSVMVKELAICKTVLHDRARLYKYLVSHKIASKEEALDKFRDDAYVIILIIEQMCYVEYVNSYRKLYNQLKNEIKELILEEMK